jgi:hypothetical protein
MEHVVVLAVGVVVPGVVDGSFWPICSGLVGETWCGFSVVGKYWNGSWWAL